MSLSLYGFLVGLGFTIFWSILERELKKHFALPEKALFVGLLFVAGGSLLGARLYHVWTDWPWYQNASLMELLAVWNGGLGIYGAIGGGLLGLFLWKRWFAPQLSWLVLLDAAALGLPVGQAVARWGNYVNQELFGLPTSVPWAISIAVENRPLGYEEYSTFHPLFFYESLALVLLAGFFLLLRRKFAQLFPLGNGWYIGNYLFASGMIRFSLELLRIHSALGWWGLTIAQWVSLLFSLAGLVLFSRAFRLQWKSDETDSETADRPRSDSLSAKRRSRAGSERDRKLQHRQRQ
jgi:prolipoprotein diacylglyceryl transferase